MNVDLNNIYLDTDSYYLSNDFNSSCSFNYVQAERRLREIMDRVFTFQIIANFMVFSDA